MSSYEYHQILQFLYFEGYADSYAEAEELVESLSDEEFQDLIYEATVDDRLRADQKKIIRNRRLSPGQRLPVRGETPEDTEERLTQNRQDQTARDRGGRTVRGSQLPKYKKHAEYGGVTFQNDFYPEKISARLEKLRAKRAKNNIRSFREEVVEYLFVEGYADSLDGAEVMAENISYNWVNEILDEARYWYHDKSPESQKKFREMDQAFNTGQKNKPKSKRPKDVPGRNTSNRDISSTQDNARERFNKQKEIEAKWAENDKKENK